MKTVVPRRFDPSAAKTQVTALQAQFTGGAVRKERDQILPLLQSHTDALMAAARLFGFEANLYAEELRLAGDFAADFVVGDNRDGESTTLFIECESAEEKTAFRRKGRKSTPDFAPALLGGFAQVVDWMRCIDDLRRSFLLKKTLALPEGDSVRYCGLVLVGLDSDLDAEEQRRLQWLSDKVWLGDSRVLAMTYDRFLLRLEGRLA